MGGIIRKAKKLVKKFFKAITAPFSWIADALGGFFTPDIPSYGDAGSYDAAQQGILVNKQSNVASIPVVYGKRKVGGTRVFISNNGSGRNEYLYVALVLCEGEIDSMTDFYVNDEKVPLNGALTHGNEREPSSGRFAGRLKVQAFMGTDNQSASSLLKNAPGWGDSHRLRGLAYLALRFEWKKATEQELKDQKNSNPYAGVPTVNVIVKGKKVLTSYSGKSVSTNTSTYGSDSTSYSTNPADCLLDYLRNPRYGKGLNDNRIDFATFHTARGLLATTYTFASGVTLPLLDCNATIRTEDTIFNNTKILLQACRGLLPYQEGRYKLVVETSVSSPGTLFEINDDNIIGNFTVSGEAKGSQFNTASVSFSNEDKNYETDTVQYTNSTYLTEDGNEILKKDFVAAGITNQYQVRAYAEKVVKRSRAGKSISFKGDPELAILQVGDVVRFKHGYKGDESTATASDWMFNYDYNSTTNSLFRVSSLRHNADGLIDVILLEHDNDIWTITQGQEMKDLTEDNLPTPPSKSPPVPPPGKTTTVTFDTSYTIAGWSGNFTIKNIDPTVDRITVTYGYIGQEQAFTWNYNNAYDPWKLYLHPTSFTNWSKMRYKVSFTKGNTVYPIVADWVVVNAPDPFKKLYRTNGGTLI